MFIESVVPGSAAEAGRADRSGYHSGTGREENRGHSYAEANS